MASRRQPYVHLPIDITIDILSRLPVKSLLRFKSVCKNWYALIKSSDFIAKQQSQSTLNPDISFSSLLVTTVNRETHDRRMSLHYFNNDSFGGGPINLDFPFLIGNNGGGSTSSSITIVGICNGLVCVSLSRFGYPLILCNPATRESREIPVHKWWDYMWCPNYVVISGVTYGFGYDPVAHDYKLIRVVYYTYFSNAIEVRADLYAMSTDTWREIDVNNLLFRDGEDDFVVGILGFGSGAAAVINGVLYWPGYVLPIDDVMVVSFDMGDEVFRKLATPLCLGKCWELTKWRFSQFKDQLALVLSRDDKCFDVWVCNENGRSWTNPFKVGSFPRIVRPIENSEVILVGCAKNGELVMADRKKSGDMKLFLYDPKSQETKNLHFDQVLDPSCINLYMETLVPVKINNAVTEINEAVLNKKKRRSEALNS